MTREKGKTKKEKRIKHAVTLSRDVVFRFSVFVTSRFRSVLRYAISNGLSLLSAYTRGKLVDDASTTVGFLGQAGAQQDAYDRAADRSISSQDISYRLVTGFIYDLPFGRDRKFGSDWSGPVNWILGGWQVNGIATFQSGYPLLITQGVNNTNLFSPSQRPTWNGEDATISDGSTADRLQRWFDTSDYSVTPAFRFGNTPRVTTLRADGMKNLDFSLFKNNIFNGGKLNAQLRMEMFNALNRVQFSPPNTQAGNANFGVVSGQANGPRQIQMAIKLIF